MEPTDPIERIEPAEPIESTEPSEPTESTDAREATERRELLMPRLMYPPNASANSVATSPVLPDPPDIACSKNPRDTRRHLAPPIVDRQRRSFVNCITAGLAGTLPGARHAGLGDAFLVPQAGTLALVPPDRGGRESAAFELRHRWTRGLCDLHVVEHRQGVREGGDDRDAPTPPEMRSYLAVNAVRRDARHRGAPPLLSYTRTCARQTVHTPTTWARQEGPFALRYVRGEGLPWVVFHEHPTYEPLSRPVPKTPRARRQPARGRFPLSLTRTRTRRRAHSSPAWCERLGGVFSARTGKDQGPAAIQERARADLSRRRSRSGYHTAVGSSSGDPGSRLPKPSGTGP